MDRMPKRSAVCLRLVAALASMLVRLAQRGNWTLVAFLVFLPLATFGLPITHAGAATFDQPPLETPVQIETAFLNGLRMMEAGDFRGAVRIFRRILSGNPNLPRVRLELARAYFLAESWVEARAEFTAVLSGDVPLGVKKTILKFINAIDSRREFDWNISFGLSASPNANRNYKTDTVELDFLGNILPFKIKREDGEPLGVALDASLEARQEVFHINDEVPAIGFVQGFVDLFEAPGEKSDDYIVGGSAGLRFVYPQATALISARTSIRNYAGARLEDRIGLKGGVDWRSTGGRSYFVSASSDRVDNHLSDFQDGTEHRVSLGLAQSIGGNTTIGGAAYMVNFKAGAAFESYDDWGVEALGRTDIGFGIGVNSKIFFHKKMYDEKAPLFLKKRSDAELGLDIELSKNDVFWFGNIKPLISLGFSRNSSSIDVFSYDEFRFFSGVKNAF